MAGLRFDSVWLIPKLGLLKPAVFVLKLFPIPKDLKYLQGFHPVPVGLFPQSLQETPEGTRENKHLLMLTPVGGVNPDPLPTGGK